MTKKLYTNNKTTLLQISIIFILTMAVYANSIHNNFTNWDDAGLIVNNTSIRSLDLKKIISILTPHKGSTFQPVRVLSYAIDYHISKLNPITFHIHNMILHGFAAIFLYLLVLEILPFIGAVNFTNIKPNIKNKKANYKNSNIEFYRNAAFLTALLFAIHPINTEAVAWMSGRKYTLLTFWGFAAFLLFVKSSKNNTFHPVIYTLSFIFTIIAILASPFGIAFPILFFLFDYCRDNKLNPFTVFKKRFIYFAPYLILTVFFLSVFSQTIIRLGGDQGGTGGTITGRYTEDFLSFVYTTLRVVFDYLRNLIAPFYLANRYTDVISHSIFQVKPAIAMIVIVITATVTFVRAIKGKRLLLFCFGWTLITWLPASNIIPISTLMADRYFYLPAPGLFFLFSVAVVTLFSKIKNYNQRKIAFILFIIIISGYLIPVTLQANRVWNNSETLWRNCLKKYPNFYAYMALSNALVTKANTYSKEDNSRKKIIDEAVFLLTEVTRLMPDNPDAFINLGTLFANEGKIDLSIKYYKLALSFNSPDIFAIQQELAKVLSYNQNNKEAFKLYKKLLKSQPDNLLFIKALGLTAERLNDYDSAVFYYSKIIKLNPDDTASMYKKAVMLEKAGAVNKAMEQYEKLLKINPEHLEGHNNLGAIYFRSGDFNKAILHFKKVLKKEPAVVIALYNLAVCYVKQNKTDKARDYFRKILLINPLHKGAQKGIWVLDKNLLQ